MASQVIDTRQIGKFRVYDNVQDKWNDWKFQFVSWLSLVQTEFPTYLDQAEKSATVVNMLDNVIVKNLAVQLHAILALSAPGRGLRAVRSVKDRNGFEAWRQLVDINEPNVATIILGTLASLTRPNFGTEEAFEERCRTGSLRLRATSR